MIDTVIFDLDGTLLNTLDDLKDSTNFALRNFGCPERSLEEVRCFVGNGVKNSLKGHFPEGQKTLILKIVCSCLRKIMHRICIIRLHLMTG